jgi:hypothetical protein
MMALVPHPLWNILNDGSKPELYIKGIGNGPSPSIFQVFKIAVTKFGPESAPVPISEMLDEILRKKDAGMRREIHLAPPANKMTIIEKIWAKRFFVIR